MKVLSYIRAVLLVIATIFIGGLIFLEPPYESIGGLKVLLLVPIIYFLAEIISLVCQIVLKKRDVRNAFLSVLYNRPAHRTIDFFRRISLCGVVSYIAVLIGTAKMQDLSGDYFAFLFEKYMLWCIIVFIVMCILTAIQWMFYTPHEGEGVYTAFAVVGKIAASDIFVLFYDIKAIFNSEKNAKVKRIVIVLFDIISTLWCVIGVLHIFRIV